MAAVFKVLVVDDEPMMLDGWRSIVDWTGHGYELCGMAEDGLEALSFVESGKIDLLVTDIRMPLMDGLELIRTLQEDKGIRVKTVIVSGYSEFSYAQQAMRYQVEHYLLKPLLPDEIHRLLAELAPPLEEERRREAARDKDTAAAAASIIVRLLGGGAADALEEASRLLGAEKHSRCRLIVAEDAAGPRDNTGIGTALENRLKPIAEAFRKNKLGAWSFRVGPGRIGLLIIGPETEEEGFESLLADASTGLEDLLRQTALFCSGAAELSLLPELYRQIENMRGRRLPGQRQGVFRHAGCFQPGPCTLEEVTIRTDSLVRSIQAADFKAIDSSVDRLSDLLAQAGLRGGWRRMVLDHVRGELLRAFGEAAVKPIAGRAAAEQSLLLRERPELIPAEEADAALKRICAIIAHDLAAAKPTTSDARKAVEEAVAMLKREFRSRIKLQEVAGALGFHPVYFGQQFKREAGLYFHDYVHRLRIEEAQRLLRRTDLKMASIAKSLGYRDTDTFTAKFKAIAGELPSAYKSRWSR
ncbi:YesN15 [Paenibacillus sp. P22]|nr:YesN15 [Paenibacillus sp. P22]